jgi:single-strand DNA-binding protein
MLNEVNLIGNLGKDPEIRYTNDGKPIANFSMATSKKWKSESGEQQEKTEWHRCVAFGKLAEIIEKFVKKGSRIYFSGEMQTRKYTGNDGVERYSTEIVASGFNGKLVLLDRKEGNAPPPQGSAQPPAQEQTAQTVTPDANDAPFNDEIPF